MIFASATPGEIRLAAVLNGVLEAYALWRPGAPDGLGDIHIARITARIPAMAGAFLALADTEAFLPDSDGAAGHTEGDYLTVRITRTAQAGKGPRLTAIQGAKPDGPPRLVTRGPTPLARLAQCHPQAAITIDDPAWFASLRPQFPGRLRLAPLSFDDELQAELEALALPFVDLPGGLRATITPTPALVAIDVDGASSTASRTEKSTLQFATNRAALPALARQIRVRNLSGAILIDLAGIQIKRRASLAPDLAACLAADPARPRLLGFTHLGLAEILRPRTTPPLHELLTGPHAAGLAALRDLIRNPTRRALLRAAPAVVAALQADDQALADLASRTTHPLVLRSDPSLAANRWVIENSL